MKIGWIGFHYEGLLAFENILKLGYKIEIFITLKEEYLIKKSGYTKTYKKYCKTYNIPVVYINNINDPEIVSLLEKMKLDIVFVIGWGQIISDTILKLPKYGMIGAHASLLPKNRGSAPINWSIINGELKSGNSLIKLSPGVDEGEIIDQQEFDITPFDNCKTLYDKVAVTNKLMIQKALESLISGKFSSYPQPKTEETILPRRRPSDGKIDWSKSSYEIYNFIRALTEPYPGAFSYIAGEKWIIWNASLIPLDNYSEYKHGQIIGQVINNKKEACGKLIACEDGYIIIHSMQNSNNLLISGYELAQYQFKLNFFSSD